MEKIIAEAVALQLDAIANGLRDGSIVGEFAQFSMEHQPVTLLDGTTVISHRPTGRVTVQLTYVKALPVSDS